MPGGNAMQLPDFRQIRAVITDVDGVMTDGRVLVMDGAEGKFFSIKDGLAIKAASELGFPVAILTGRASQAVAKRASELGIHVLKNGRLDKQSAFREILDELSLEASQVAYVGDDLPDMAPMTLCGCSFCPVDAAIEIREIADVVVPVAGGYGVLRWVLGHILSQQGLWSKVVEHFEVKHA